MEKGFKLNRKRVPLESCALPNKAFLWNHWHCRCHSLKSHRTAEDFASFVLGVLQPGLDVQKRQVTWTEPQKQRKFPKECLGKVHFHSIYMYHLSWEDDQSGQSPTIKLVTVG